MMTVPIEYRHDPLTSEERDSVLAALPSYYGGDQKLILRQIEQLLRERTMDEAWQRYGQMPDAERETLLWRFAEELPNWKALIAGEDAPQPEEEP